jgi:hypothetical protein
MAKATGDFTTTDIDVAIAEYREERRVAAFIVGLTIGFASLLAALLLSFYVLP